MADFCVVDAVLVVVVVGFILEELLIEVDVSTDVEPLVVSDV